VGRYSSRLGRYSTRVGRYSTRVGRYSTRVGRWSLNSIHSDVEIRYEGNVVSAPGTKDRQHTSAMMRLLLLAVVLAVASYSLSLLLFGEYSYYGEPIEGAFAARATWRPWATLRREAALLGLYVASYLVLLGLGQGLLSGFGCLRRKPIARPWPWRAALAVLFQLLVLLQAMALQPALFDEHFYQAGARSWMLRSVVEAAVGLGPYWIAPLGLGLVGYVLSAWRRLGTKKALVGLVALGLGGLLLAMVPIGRRPHEPSPRPPNLLILASDSLRADHLRPDTAPYLLGLASRGAFIPELRISIARSESSWATLLTGRWPPEHGIRQMFPSRAQSSMPLPTIMHALRRAGYRTFATGGFCADTFATLDLGIADTDVPRPDVDTLLEGRAVMAQPLLAAYATFPYLDALFPALRLEPTFPNPKAVTRRLLARLDAMPAGTPFAGIAVYGGTHFPYVSSYPYYLRAGPSYRGRHRFAKQDLLRDPAPPDAAEIRQIRALYAAAVAEFDEQLAAVTRHLEERGLLAHTIVVVLGDHGEELYDDGESMGHGDQLHGHGNQTPLILVGPGIGPRDAPLRERMRDVDLAPTLRDLLGLSGFGEPPSAGEPAFGGQSFAGLLTRGEPVSSRDMYYETELWFSDDKSLVWQRSRIDYPAVPRTLALDGDGRLRLGSAFEDLVLSAKHRALETDAGTIVYQPTLFGPRWAFYPPGEAQDRFDDPAFRRAAGDTEEQLIRRTMAFGETWINGRIVPSGRERRSPGPISFPSSGGRWVYELHIRHDASEPRAAHYQGELVADAPLSSCGDGGAQALGGPLGIDVTLQPGQSRAWCFYPAEPITQAELRLSCDGEALSATDLFTGDLNLRPFSELSAMNLAAEQQALVDYGGYRSPTALWLGLRTLPGSGDGAAPNPLP
jgi:hypothetical protein